MHLRRLDSARRRLAVDEGFTMIIVLGVLAATMALGVAAFAASNGDIPLARNDQDQKRAYAAAEAGVQDYFFHLTQDNAYWTKCASPNPPHPALNQLRASPLKTRQVPSSSARYAIELIPANGHTFCDTADPEGTLVVATGPQSGTFSIRSTGLSNNVKRSIVATFRRRSFLDYLYFTDMETTDPVWYVLSTNGNATRSGTWNSHTSTFTPSAHPDLPTWAATNCTRYWRNSRGSQSYPTSPDNAWEEQVNGVWQTPPFTSTVGCKEIQFVGGDTIQGPLHTNDDILVCNSPTFGRGPQDNIEVSGSGWRQNSGCSGSPNVKGTWKPNSPVLTPPPSDTSLKQVVDPAYLLSGTTTIVLNNASMTVTNANLSPTTQTLPFPPNGVLYVDNGACGVTAYQPLAPYSDPAGCADVYVSGTYSADLTIASAKDIIVRGSILRSGDPMLGLIANNFIRIYHPVNPDPQAPTDHTRCVNASGTPTNVEVDAAVLALNHSFTVDSYFCGSPLGTLTVKGTIAQEFRGPVGTGSGSNIATGYLKNYTYDDRLRLREPPHFLDPVQASWRIQRYAEQVGGG